MPLNHRARHSAWLIFILGIWVITLTINLYAQSNNSDKEPYSLAASAPDYQMALHDIGNISFGITNWGQFGHGDVSRPLQDVFTGQTIPDLQYPKGTRTKYLYKGGIWVGGVVGRDTLVSTACEFNNNYREFKPGEYPFGNIERGSILDEASTSTFEPFSQQDYVITFTDTVMRESRYLSYDPVDRRPHEPLHLEVTIHSFAWSYSYADDFVIFEVTVRNIGDKPISGVYIGLYMDQDVHEDLPNTDAVMTGGGKPSTDGVDDLAGMLMTYPASFPQCNHVDTLYQAYTIDNDGDPSGLDFIVGSIAGVKLLKKPLPTEKVSFNWWVYNYNPAYDFGPQKKESYREMDNGLGTPIGDRDKYYLMRNGEIDYDQYLTRSIPPYDYTWLYPRYPMSRYYSMGADVQYLLSIGPYNMAPGTKAKVPFALVAGTNLHQYIRNYRYHLQRSYFPDYYYQNLNFSNFAYNSLWASWVYDNPGVDTDTNDFYGNSIYCCDAISCDTFYYEGDGVPDYRGATAPDPPKVWIEPGVNQIKVRWNGLKSENSRDVFSREYDFEGYRVYLARDNRDVSYMLLATYDIEDYNKYWHNTESEKWELQGSPFSPEELRCDYGTSCDDSLFNPNDYPRSSPYIRGDSLIAFEPQDFNRSIFENFNNATTPIRKRFPDQPKPSTLDPAEADPSELTEDGYFKYYEYEFTITNLLPTVPYYVNVTAFDYGSPRANLGPLETSKVNNALEAYAHSTTDQVAAENLPVYVYPNPYRIDGKYLENSYEGRNARYFIPERLRRIHFVNVPPKCTISIFSLDGDLIRSFRHEADPESGTASHATWDLITRNTQAVVTGIYYWVVEDDNGGTQMGKLVIMK